ncbi:MAG: RDD family protein [Herpetosiphonaceae bacterium]|nr:RDD family protein [Herpetosiphonaceae bacterium]
MLDDHLLIETPEQIALSYDIAGIGARFVAALVDHILIGVLIALLAAVAISLSERNLLAGSLAFGLAALGGYLLLCGYYIFFETLWNGQTPGKRLIGLRVMRPGGRPIGFLGSATRNIIRLIDFLPIFYGIGLVAMFIDRHGRRLGDLAAGALTVKEQRSLTLQSLVATEGPLPPGPVAERLTIPNLQVITPADYRLIQDYLRQRLELSLSARRRLSGQLLQGLQRRLGYPIYGDPEAFLLRFVAEYNAFHAQAVPAVI